MPWESIQGLLKSIPALKAWPRDAQEQFRAVVNKCLRAGGSEESCIKQAWGAIEQGRGQ